MEAADPRAIFLHCLPAHRGEEVGRVGDRRPAQPIFAQAHNRMHSVRGLLSWLVEVNGR